jgi:asparagine N-glycosylation enzyme membrane subunit Stt3
LSSEGAGEAGGKSSEAEERRIFTVAALALAVFPALLLFRRFDDNTLTSWRWVFRFCDATPVFVFYILAIAGAYFLSYLSFRGRRPAALLFAFSYLAAVLLWSEPEAIIDSSRYFTQAKNLSLHGAGYFFREWGGRVFAWTDLPLVPFIYGTVFRLLGESRHWIQAVTSLMFAMTVVLTFLIGRRLWDEEAGFLGGALLLGSPYLLTQVPLMLVDVPTMFFSILSIFLLIIALEEGGAARLVLSAVAVLLALGSKYSTWVLHGSTLAVVVLALLLRDGPRPVLRRAAFVGATSAALFVTLVLVQYGSVAPQLDLLQAYQWPGLQRWGESFASTLLFQTHPFLSLLAVCSVYVAVRKRDVTYLIVAWMWVVIVLLQVRRIRYVIPAMPMLALMGAYGLRLLRGERLRRFAAFCAVGGSLAVALAAYRPFLGNMSIANLQAAGAFLDSRTGIRAARVTTAYR